jgi:hypothetical protein
VLSAQSRDVADFLETLASNTPTVGSKFVFDTCLSRSEARSFREKLGADVKIIHLTRSYRDVFLSRRRGFYHLLNAAESAQLGKHIKTAIINARPPDNTPTIEARIVDPLTCSKELNQYVHNDALVAQLLARGRPYLHVEYAEINSKLAEIARFIGSAATPAEIAYIIDHPPVLKLPSVPPVSLVANIAALESLFEAADAARLKFVDTGSPMSG